MVDALIAWAESNQAVGGHAVPARRRDRAGERRRRAGPAGRRGAHRASPSPRSSARAHRVCTVRSSRPPTCAPARRRWARPSRSSACSPARSSPGATAFRSAAAAGSAPPTPSTRRPRRSRRSCCGPRCWPAPTSCCTRPAGSRAGSRASLEKFALDVELLEQFQPCSQPGSGSPRRSSPSTRSRRSGRVGSSSRHRHTPRTSRSGCTCRRCSRPTTTPRGRPRRRGQRAHRANLRWKQLLASYEDPGLDPAIDEELRAFIERRKLDPPEPEDLITSVARARAGRTPRRSCGRACRGRSRSRHVA